MNQNTYSIFSYARNILAKNQARISCWQLFNKFSSKTIHKTHYETLNVSRTSTTKEIKDAFIALSKKHHPDKNKGNPVAQQQFVKINEAYSVLVKPESRRDYDSSLEYYGHHAPGPTPAGRSNFYGDHRRQPSEEEYYEPREDPWKDPSFFRNRKFYGPRNEDDYYGIKGIKRQSNETVLKWIFLFFAAGLVIQVTILRLWRVMHYTSDERVKDINRQYYQRVRERAYSYATEQERMEALEKRLNYKPEEDNN